MDSFLSGFGLSLSLIFAIGAQNAFVLKQGLNKEHIFMVCLVCALSDSLLILVGVFGFGSLIQHFPLLQSIARYGGFIFLLLYALKSFYTAWSMSHMLTPQNSTPTSLKKTLFLALMFTWLNPHVYLDTVILLGSISAQFGELAPIFGLGAISSSCIFFFSLGYGARLLSPLFCKVIAWKILETLIGITMFILAFKVLFS